MKADQASRFARRLGRFLNSLTQEEVAGVADGELRIGVLPRSASGTRAGGRAEPPSVEELGDILSFLHEAESREAGFKKLEEAAPTKSTLEALARAADLPVVRRDTVDDLRAKIVEATIGYRLRSRAVQGRDVTSKGHGD